LKDSSYGIAERAAAAEQSRLGAEVPAQYEYLAEELAADVREVSPHHHARGQAGDATLYLVEVKQAGVFSIAGASPDDLKRLIGSFCPSVLFP